MNDTTDAEANQPDAKRMTLFGTISGLVIAAAAIVGATLTIEARFENESDARTAHDALEAQSAQAIELLAAENEAARLQTQLELYKIRIEKFRDLANIRPLTEAEQIELRSIERERDAVLNRLAAKG